MPMLTCALVHPRLDLWLVSVRSVLIFEHSLGMACKRNKIISVSGICKIVWIMWMYKILNSTLLRNYLQNKEFPNFMKKNARVPFGHNNLNTDWCTAHCKTNRPVFSIQIMNDYECNGTNIFMWWKRKCSIQRAEAELNGTFHLSPHENICSTARMKNIHYLFYITPK